MSNGAPSQPAGDETKEQPSASSAPPLPSAASSPSSAASQSLVAGSSDLRLSSVIGCSFPDDLSRHILQLLQPFASTPHLELEGKLGRCVLPATHLKPSFPQLLDCLLPLDPHSSQHVFEAEVPMRVFRHLNDGVMKGRFEREQDDSRRERRAARLSYSHPVTIDLFYATAPHQTRVTVDPATGSRHAIVKRKLSSLDFLSPPLSLPSPAAAVMPPSIDFRLTLSQESPAPLPPSTADPFRIRRKDRRSYGGEWWQVDCTVVETWASVRKEASAAVGWVGEGKAVVSYEVEVELAASQARRVKEEAGRAAAGKDNALLDIARNLLDNMRSLSIIALRPLPPSCTPRAATAASVAPSAAADSRKRSREEMEESKENQT